MHFSYLHLNRSILFAWASLLSSAGVLLPLGYEFAPSCCAWQLPVGVIMKLGNLMCEELLSPRKGALSDSFVPSYGSSRQTQTQLPQSTCLFVCSFCWRHSAQVLAVASTCAAQSQCANSCKCKVLENSWQSENGRQTINFQAYWLSSKQLLWRERCFCHFCSHTLPGMVHVF